MARKQKTYTRRKFIGAAAGATVAGGAAIAANVAANSFSSLLNHYVGGRPTTIENPEGSEGWDSEYCKAQYRGRNQAKQAATEIVQEIVAGGAVLLRNENAALPLAAGEKVSLLGRYGADPVYGGAGSGTVDPADCVTLLQGLQNAGLDVNAACYDHALANLDSYPKAEITMDTPATASYYIGEIPWADYPSDVQASIEGTVGLVVVGRGGGEGGDLSRDLRGDLDSGISSAFVANAETANYAQGQHELELTKEELDLVDAAKAACTKVVVLMNASTTMELGPLVSGGHAVDAILHIGSLGAAGANGVGQILAGQANPSGRTCDIWAADFTADPTFGNFGGRRYADVSGYYTKNYNNIVSDGTAYFVEYREGIYFGYRYYETADAEAQAGRYPGFDYAQAVTFPFGYGLSYTTFAQTLDSVSVENDEVIVQATVSNVGGTAGRDVVEVYYSAPYEPGGIQKAAVVLAAFTKTEELQPGASEKVSLSFPVRQMASWSRDDGCWVLDAGIYVVSLRTDSHTVVAAQDLQLEAQEYRTDEVTGTQLENRFSSLDEYMERNCGTFSRDDFQGTFPESAGDADASGKGIEVAEYAWREDPEAQMPIIGASNGISLINLRGKAYDDPMWEELLDQLSADDMAAVINDGAYNTSEVPSIAKPATSEPDGPAGFTSLTGSTGNCAYCSEYLMAETWDTELMRRVGEAVGQEALASGYNGWYAPACDTHRSPFAGRNFEYFSEDPVLGGKICAAEVEGAASCGCYALVKHFALNDQESYRVQHLMTWATEQSMRECYLRQFEIAVKEPRMEVSYIADDKGTLATAEMPACTGIMSSFNYIGTEWAGGCKALLSDVLRDEWGFRGMVITDFNLYGYMDKAASLAAGGDLQLTYSAMTGAIPEMRSATTVSQMRSAMHGICYTVANSNAMNGLVPGSVVHYGTAPWEYMLWGGTAVLAGMAGLLGWRAYVNRRGYLEAEKEKASEDETVQEK